MKKQCVEKVIRYSMIDTKHYRYRCDGSDGNIYRIEQDKQGTPAVYTD